MGLILGYDRDTLRERVDEQECRDRLDEIREQRSMTALLEQVWLLKVLGELDEALRIAEEVVRQTRMAGTRKDLLRARVLHASVQQQRGQITAAEQTLETCVMEADGQNWPQIAAFAAHHLGRLHYEAGNLEQARKAFKNALFLRQESGANDEALETTFLAIDAVERKTARVNGEGVDVKSAEPSAERATQPSAEGEAAAQLSTAEPAVTAAERAATDQHVVMSHGADQLDLQLDEPEPAAQRQPAPSLFDLFSRHPASNVDGRA